MNRFSSFIAASTLTVLTAAAPLAAGSVQKKYVQNNKALTVNSSAWRYDAANKLYYQLGVPYVSTPETVQYESLNIYVPAAYFIAKDNGNGTFTVKKNKKGTVHGYTAATAPIVLPLETPGYVAQQPSPDYDSDGVTTFTNEGFVYVFAGMRGRANGYNADGTLAFNGGAPWGITDLKAAVRWVRFNADSLPGNMNGVYTAGMSGGGAQSALMGATGDSPLYTPYLESIGAAMKNKHGRALSDAVTGSMDWCPITSLDYADEAYEWNMGQFSATGKRDPSLWTSALSKDLAVCWAAYFNKLNLVAPDGTKLQLAKSADGICQAGTYYDYLKTVVETSLSHYLTDTQFPYTAGAQAFNAFAKFGGGVNNLPFMGGPGKSPAGGPDGKAPAGAMPLGAMQGGGAGSAQSDTGTTYNSPADYIAALNKNGTWVTYDEKTGAVKITSLKDFVTRYKNATKGVGAFDDVSLGQGENELFGTGAADKLHFDATIADLVKTNSASYAQYSGWDPSVAASFAAGVDSTDALGTPSAVRQDMYNPLYYLNAYYKGYGTAKVAKYWRIRTGIEQSDTALTTEANLALALQSYKGVKSVDFETVWNMQHTMAERTGTSMANFIAWVHSCAAKEK